ncbi:MAG TPA: hypothetical protein VLV56_10620 [Burkholderiales bacterium]|nr:hypothetical protein [Burkholderiales bacterium]
MRPLIIAGLLVLTTAGAVYAADDSLDKAAKKTSDGMGNLLKGMGQEVKKAGIGSDAKKDDKKAAKAPKEDKK